MKELSGFGLVRTRNIINYFEQFSSRYFINSKSEHFVFNSLSRTSTPVRYAECVKLRGLCKIVLFTS